MPNLELKKAILQALGNQLRLDNPKEVKQTLNRLIMSGYNEQAAKEKMAAVLLTEIYEVMKNNTPYNEERYITNLKNIK